MSTRRLRLPACSMGEFVTSTVTVRAPATSANLGPGFDTFGLALGMYDVVQARVAEAGVHVDIEGEGADAVSRDESNLVVRSARFTFDALGVAQPGLRLSCRNAIAHGRGLGSSAAAIVSGIVLADGLLGGSTVSAELALTLAAQIEGHPDNVAACLSGGFTIAWREGDGSAHVVRLGVHPDIRAAVFVPPARLSTAVARALLPADVPHRLASSNAARAALLVAAITTDPSQLLAGTHDALHQEYRRPAMPDSLALVDSMRAAGVAAMVSGAGPSVLALGTVGSRVDPSQWTPPGWLGTDLTVSNEGACLQ
ncbi:MAG: homoserine kinase [Ilumatobacteraceae bacterium]